MSEDGVNAEAALMVTITGTGIPAPAPNTAGPGVLVRSGGHVLQFDAGRGTVGRLVEAGVPPRSVSTLFVTHHHSDHLLGVTDLVMTRWITDQNAHEALEIVAPAGPAIEYLSDMLVSWQADLDIRVEHTGRPDRLDINIVPFEPTDTPTEIWAKDGVRVLSVAVHHEPVLPAVAFRVETDTGAVVISGDTRVCQEVADLAHGAQVVVHEACRSAAMRALFPGSTQIEQIVDYHADTIELGAFAEQAAIPHLVLTHLIPSPTSDEQREQFAADVREGGYTGELTVAQDLTTIVIG